MFGLLTLIITIILKTYRKEFAIYAVLIGGAIILLMSFETIGGIVDFLNKFSNDTSYNSEFVTLLLKITGISILIEYAVSICKDAGETAIGNKIDFARKNNYYFNVYSSNQFNFNYTDGITSLIINC